MNNTRVVEISDGTILEVEYNDDFFCKVRKYFGLTDVDEVSDDHLKVFFCDTFKSTLSNIENH
jgi:hypothetical protein